MFIVNIMHPVINPVGPSGVGSGVTLVIDTPDVVDYGTPVIKESPPRARCCNQQVAGSLIGFVGLAIGVTCGVTFGVYYRTC